MATPVTVAQLLATFKKWGVDYEEVRSWRSHNRSAGRAWGPMNGIVIHHTASSNDAAAVKLVYDGRSDLPGPLAHVVTANTGKVYLVGHGRANHAGSGDSRTLGAVVAEDGRFPATPNRLDADGNARFYGNEVVNAGNGKDTYPEKQYIATLRWAASLCDHHGWSAMSVIGHKEWTNQKIDPKGPLERGGSFSMPTFRAQVQALLDHGPNGDTDVALTDADVKKILTTDGIIPSPDGAPNLYWTAASYLRETYLAVQALRAEVSLLAVEGTDAQQVADAVEAKLESLTIKLEAGAQG